MKNTSKSTNEVVDKKSSNSHTVITDSDLVFVNGDKDTLLSRCLIKLSKLKGQFRQLFENK